MNWVDVISVLAWGACGVTGLVAGFMRVWITFIFLVSGSGIAGALALLIGPAMFGFIDHESGRAAAGFLLVFGLMALLGAAITHWVRGPLTVVSELVSVFPMGAMFNRSGGLLAGTIIGCVFLSIVLLGLQQLPVNEVGRGIKESSFASRPILWLDRYVASIEISEEWKNGDQTRRAVPGLCSAECGPRSVPTAPDAPGSEVPGPMRYND